MTKWLVDKTVNSTKKKNLVSTCRTAQSQPHGGTSENPTILSSGILGGPGAWLWLCRGTGGTSTCEVDAAGSKHHFHRLAMTQQTRPRRTSISHHPQWCRLASDRCSSHRGRKGDRVGGEQQQLLQNCRHPRWFLDLQCEKQSLGTVDF